MSHTIPARIVRGTDRRDRGIDRRTGRFIGAGRNLRHRKLLSRGGKDTIGNLVSLSGSGTTGTHGWVHANPAEAEHLGLMVPSWIDDPSEVPVRLADECGRFSWVRLLDSGDTFPMTDAAAERRMRDLGIWRDGSLF